MSFTGGDPNFNEKTGRYRESPFIFNNTLNSLDKTIKNLDVISKQKPSYIIGDINTDINVEKLDNELDLNKIAKQMENKIMNSIRNKVSIAVA